METASTGEPAAVCEIVPSQPADDAAKKYPTLIFDRKLSKCFRCKLTICEGIRKGCLLQSDAFPAKKLNTKCNICKEMVFRSDPITLLKRGEYTNSYVHLECGWRWCFDNPTSVEPVFQCLPPAAPLVDFIKASELLSSYVSIDSGCSQSTHVTWLGSRGISRQRQEPSA